MSNPTHQAFRSIPSVESIAQDPAIADVAGALPHPLVTEIVRDVLTRVRSEVRSTGRPVDRRRVIADVDARLRLHLAGRPARVINATGIIVHTNLGRSVLGPRVAAALSDVAMGYSDLELDVLSGARGKREAQIDALMRAATGAEAALVVNNCAAAVLLALDTFAKGREVIVSRGEQVEIGGAFRMPEVVARSGARMVEVGTTNKTRLGDYAAALTPGTAVLLKVHASNFRVVGFTESAELAELVGLADEHGILVVHDLGSGAPGVDATAHPGGEPTLREMVRAGVHVVCASGDKLLGGPQAGLVVGRREHVSRMGTNPLYRALRPDKLTLAALSEALRIHLEGAARADLPTVRMLTISPAELEERAAALASELASALGDAAAVSTRAGESETGGGSLPAVPLPTTLVVVSPRHAPVPAVERALRAAHPPVVARVQADTLLLDPRTLMDGDHAPLVARMVEAVSGAARPASGG